MTSFVTFESNTDELQWISSPTGASFLRSNAQALKLGRTFIEALRDKYIERAHDDSTMERITLGSSDGAIEVEAVNMNKVRGKFARLDTLKEVGLEGYFIKNAGPPGEIAAASPS
jgi:tubulin-specific chaperone E